SQAVAGMQHGMVLHCGRDQMPAARFQQSGGAEDREIDAFRAAAGKDDFGGFATEHGTGSFAGFIQPGAGFPAHMMNGGRIAPDVAEKRQHRLPHLRIERRGGVVIEINGSRHWSREPGGGITSFRDFQNRLAPGSQEKRSSVHGSAVLEYPRTSQKPRMS